MWGRGVVRVSRMKGAKGGVASGGVSMHGSRELGGGGVRGGLGGGRRKRQAGREQGEEGEVGKRGVASGGMSVGQQALASVLLVACQLCTDSV